MELVSWNVNGINACLRNGLLDFVKKEQADVYCFQETKLSYGKVPEKFAEIEKFGYIGFHLFSNKKGYAGVSCFSKVKPLSVIYGIGDEDFDKEGRVLVLEFDKFILINTYFPNSQRGLKRIDYKMRFNYEFLKFCTELNRTKPLVICGDFNVAHTELDIKNPKQNEKNAGFTIKERNWFSHFLKNGYVDTFREFFKDGGHYTWWTYRFNARKRNIGWRIDYFVVSLGLRGNLKESKILDDVIGSDHCPVAIEIFNKK